MVNRIALLRADRGVSRRELADAVAVNPQTIGYLERGDYKPSLELALKIAEFFGVPVEALFSLRPFPPLAVTLRSAIGDFMMDIPAALDRFVHVTRLDVLTPYASRRSRNLRWWPLLVLAGLPLGFALWVGPLDDGWPTWATIAGAVIFIPCLVAASVIRLCGPRLYEEWAHPLDERERMLKAQAGNIRARSSRFWRRSAASTAPLPRCSGPGSRAAHSSGCSWGSACRPMPSLCRCWWRAGCSRRRMRRRSDGDGAELDGKESETEMADPTLRRHRMRWFALLPLTAAALALALHVDGYAFTVPLAAFASAVAYWLVLFGPPKEPIGDEQLDEREMLVRIRSREFGGRVTSGLAVMGCCILGLSTELGGWRPVDSGDWLILLFVLSTVFASIPVLYASWTTRAIEEE